MRHFLFSTLFIFSLFSQTSNKSDIPAARIKVGAFFPGSTYYKEIYPSATASYQIEGIAYFDKKLNWWANGAFTSSDGETVPLKNSLNCKTYSLSTGPYLNISPIKNIKVFLGVGVLYTWLTETAGYRISPEKVKLNQPGALLKLEVIKPLNSLLISGFLNYQFQRFDLKDPVTDLNVNLNGLILGGSIGVDL